MLLMATIALLNTSSSMRLAHPNDESGHFWERRTGGVGGGEITGRSLFGPEGRLRRVDRASSSVDGGTGKKASDDNNHVKQPPSQQQNKVGGHSQLLRPALKKRPIVTSLEVSKCKYAYFGCPIMPTELTKLNISDPKTNYYYPSHASSSHVMVTHISNRKSNVNQDRVVLMPSFVHSIYSRSKSDVMESINDPKDDFFVGVFDGHGDDGHLVSQYASEEIPSRIASKMMSSGYEDDKSKSINEDMIVRVFKEVDERLTVRDGGTTATVMLRVGNKLYMANTGDSTAFVCTYQPPDYYDKQLTAYNKAYVMKKRDGRADSNGNEEQQLYLQGSIVIHNQNERHKPHFPLEKSRIEKLGGRVHVPLSHPENSRVIVHEYEGAHKGDDVGLAMSRSIGDKDWTAVGVIPDPDVRVIDLGEFFFDNDVNGAINGAEKRVFVVLGSDGLFDARKAEYVASHLAYGLFEWGQGWGQRKEDRNNEELQQVFSNHLLEVGKKIVDMASPLKDGAYRDDISFIAKRIELQD
jgi:serine/threonine protein phosphatase PrpC